MNNENVVKDEQITEFRHREAEYEQKLKDKDNLAKQDKYDSRHFNRSFVIVTNIYLALFL
jgi:hypothetical protein